MLHHRVTNPARLGCALREDAINRARLAVRMHSMFNVESDDLGMTDDGTYVWFDENGYMVTLLRDCYVIDVRL